MKGEKLLFRRHFFETFFKDIFSDPNGKLCGLSKLKYSLSSVLCGIVIHCMIRLVGFVLGK